MGELTIKDIAKACGVGVSTVSRAINNHPDINLDCSFSERYFESVFCGYDQDHGGLCAQEALYDTLETRWQ